MKPDPLLPNEFADASGCWDQFFQWARTRRNFIFRGQSVDTWPVWSSYHRHMNAKGRLPEEEDLMEPDSNYLIDAHVVAHQLYPELQQTFDFNEHNQLTEFLSIAQHHGFPTPLIDFTESPFVAAYFAVKDAEEGRPCRIICVNIQLLGLYKLLHNAKEIDFVRPLPKHNKRIVVQQGLFILSLKSDLLRQLAALQKEPGPQVDAPASNVLKQPLVGGFLLKVERKQEILADLDLMGINEYTLFGGLDGAFRHQKWKQF